MALIALPLIIPWLLAVGLAFFDGRRGWVNGLAVAGLAAGFVATLRLAGQVISTGPVEAVTGGWPAGIGITLRADSLGVSFTLLATGLLLIAMIYEAMEEVHERYFPALVLFLAAGLTGLFLTGDAFNFYVFFEVSMTASFVLVSYGQGRRQIRDTLVFTVVNLIGSVLFLVAVAALYRVTGTLEMAGIATWVSAVEPNSIILIATLIFTAFSIKLGLFPFHFWLPPVYSGSQTVVAAILSGVLANIGSYGLLRFGAHILRLELQFGAAALLVLAGASVLYGALLAISRRTTQEVIAYSAISSAGYILIGLVLGGPAGYTAAVIYAIVNALNKTLLFLAAGLRGWLVGAAFVIGAFSVAGIPPTVGFWGKAALFKAGIAGNNPAMIVVVLLGGAMSFIYMFQIYQRRFWVSGDQVEASPLRLRILVLGLAAVVVGLGVWPEPVLALSRQIAIMIQETLP